MNADTPWPNARILIVDDEPAQVLFLTEALELLDFKVEGTSSATEALLRLEKNDVEVLITDLRMPEMEGLELVERALKLRPRLSVIMVTGHGSIETAVAAMKLGAADYLRKPIELVELQMILHRLWKARCLVDENQELNEENENLRRGMGLHFHFTNALGSSGLAQSLLSRIRERLEDRKPVLILGEPGCALDDIARMIHYNGPWAPAPLSIFECPTVPAGFQEAHLFGASVGGAGRKGLVERTEGGSLVISSVKDLDSSCHERFLDMIGKCLVEPTPSVRCLITAELAAGQVVWNSSWVGEFQNLLFNSAIRVPPLRARKGDIPAMATAIALRTAAVLGKKIERIEPGVLAKLAEYEFPGNHRELEGMLEAACMRCEGPTLEAKDFSRRWQRGRIQVDGPG